MATLAEYRALPFEQRLARLEQTPSELAGAVSDRAVPDARTPAELNDSRKEQNSRLTEAAQ
jgi:hypothetical protein